MMPISAALVSVLFLGERFTWMHAIGMALVLSAIQHTKKRSGYEAKTLFSRRFTLLLLSPSL